MLSILLEQCVVNSEDLNIDDTLLIVGSNMVFAVSTVSVLFLAFSALLLSVMGVLGGKKVSKEVRLIEEFSEVLARAMDTMLARFREAVRDLAQEYSEAIKSIVEKSIGNAPSQTAMLVKQIVGELFKNFESKVVSQLKEMFREFSDRVLRSLTELMDRQAKWMETVGQAINEVLSRIRQLEHSLRAIRGQEGAERRPVTVPVTADEW